MKILKKFLEEKRGVSIVEYVLILCFVGSVVVAVTPSLRHQVGEMYNHQANTTSQLNGMDGAEVSSRYEFGEAPIGRTPNVSDGNTGDQTYTDNPTPETYEPEKKTIVIEVRKTEDEFEEQVEYDKDGYFGMLMKDPSGSTVIAVEKRQETDTKNLTETIQRQTFDELESIKSYEKTDAEGYSGTMNPSGDIQYVPASTNGTEQQKPSGNVYMVKETEEADVVLVENRFPNEYFYEEMDSSTGTYTGYTGNLTKQGEMQRTMYVSEGKTMYRYEQIYSGILTKGDYQYEYVYEREFTGTLFKTNEENVYEYVQKYSGEVTKVD